MSVIVIRETALSDALCWTNDSEFLIAVPAVHDYK